MCYLDLCTSALAIFFPKIQCQITSRTILKNILILKILKWNHLLLYLKRSEKCLLRDERCALQWLMNLKPTVYPQKLLSKPSLLTTQQSTCSLPRKRFFSDELSISTTWYNKNLSSLNESIAPTSFQFKKFYNCVLYFNLVSDDKTIFPKILQSIKVDDDLHVQLQYNGMPLPLLQCFVQDHNVVLEKLSYFENFPAYIRNTATDNYNELLNELNQRNFYKPQRRPPYSASKIQYALNLLYTSLQAYRLLLEKFPMPSLSLVVLMR